LAVDKGLERRRLVLEARRLQQVEEEARRLGREKEMLQELDRVKSAFMRKVAHELRAPLAAIRSFLNLMLSGYVSPEDQRPMQQRAAERADELLALIDDLLSLAKLKEIKGSAKVEPVDPAKPAHDVLGLHAGEAAEKRITLQVEIDPCPSVLADPAHIKQLWSNLISNAIKYTPSGGQVSVRLFPEGGMIVGEVKDTGIGIAEQDLPNLFQEFFRTEQAKAFAQHGTGLGLSIAKQIVQEYGGDIRVESELGTGTRFTFWLPTGSQAPSEE
jgi:signal transduction histidine kinase